MSLGHNTYDALRILHDELEEIVAAYEARNCPSSLRQKLNPRYLHHHNKESPVHWTSIVVLGLFAFFLILAYICQTQR